MHHPHTAKRKGRRARNLQASTNANGSEYHEDFQPTPKAASFSRERGQSSIVFYHNARIADCAREGDVEGAEEQFEQLQREGVKPTRCTFNSIINAQKVRGDMRGAERWVHRLLESGVRPNAVTYTTMISGFAQTGDVANAKRWFQRLIDAGCQPTEHTHNALVYAHCQAGDLAAAEECLHAYLATPDPEAHPSIVAFNTIVHACGRLGRSDKAIFWFHEVVRRGLVPSNSTFCAVLNAFAEMGAFAEIEKYSALMASYGLPLADISHRALIKACAHLGDYQKAEQLFQRILDQGDSAASTFNTMIHTCTQTGNIEGAERYFMIMEEKGLEPCAVTFNTLINACAAQGDTEKAERWLMRMLDRQVTPNEITYGTLCKAFARQGNVEKVKHILGVLQSSGHSLNEYFYASLISACGVAQPPDKETAEEAFAEFVRRGYKPQRVRRVLARVVGDRRAAQLLNNTSGSSIADGCFPAQASRPRAARAPPQFGPQSVSSPSGYNFPATTLSTHPEDENTTHSEVSAQHWFPEPEGRGAMAEQRRPATLDIPVPRGAGPHNRTSDSSFSIVNDAVTKGKGKSGKGKASKGKSRGKDKGRRALPAGPVLSAPEGHELPATAWSTQKHEGSSRPAQHSWIAPVEDINCPRVPSHAPQGAYDNLGRDEVLSITDGSLEPHILRLQL